MTGSIALLLEGAFVLTLDDAGTAGELSVAVRDGTIADVGERDRLRTRFGEAQRIDCTGSILMPGLVNAHLHPEVHVLKGIVEDVDLHGWAHAERLERALTLLGTDELRWIQRAGVRAALADCLLSGTTCVATYGVTAGADEVAAAELSAFGLRGHVTIRDTAFAPATDADGMPVIPAHRLEPPRMYRLHAEEALTEDELIAAAGAHARGERIVMHAAETRYRIRLAQSRFGSTTLRLLDRHDLLSAATLLSHAVHLDEWELTLLERSGAAVIASPAAEMKLSDGIAPVTDYIERGVTVALGTDSALCNNSNDMLLECRQLGFAQKLAQGADVLPAERILRCATRGGALALGEADRYGAIAPGLSADLILVDTLNPRLQPLVHGEQFSNVAANLVYAATGQDVRDVMVAGRWLVRDGGLLSAEPDRIWQALAEAALTLHAKIDGSPQPARMETEES